MQKKNKYSAKRVNGFSSKLEHAVYELLKTKEKLGLISDIKCQQSVVLQEGGREQRITWRVDFSYFDLSSKELVYVEAKGLETDVYKLKLKLWLAKRPYRLEIYKGSYRRPHLVQTIFK